MRADSIGQKDTYCRTAFGWFVRCAICVLLWLCCCPPYYGTFLSHMAHTYLVVAPTHGHPHPLPPYTALPFACPTYLRHLPHPSSVTPPPPPSLPLYRPYPFEHVWAHFAAFTTGRGTASRAYALRARQAGPWTRTSLWDIAPGRFAPPYSMRYHFMAHDPLRPLPTSQPPMRAHDALTRQLTVSWSSVRCGKRAARAGGHFDLPITLDRAAPPPACLACRDSLVRCFPSSPTYLPVGTISGFS